MVKKATFIAVFVIFAVFILQNTQVLEVRFWFWKTQASRAIVLLITFIVGLGIGYLAGILKKSSSASAKKTAANGNPHPKNDRSATS